MKITVAIAVFVIAYIIQLVLCFYVKNRHIKLIPTYLGLTGVIFFAFHYLGVFGSKTLFSPEINEAEPLIQLARPLNEIEAIACLSISALYFTGLGSAYVTYKIIMHGRNGK